MVCSLTGATILAVFIFAIIAGIGFVIGGAIARIFVK
jgi:hypothetical protein